jgi:hypothetical protein
MARTDVAVRQTQASGELDAEAHDTALHATDGAKFTNDGRTRLWVKNAGAGSHTVTIKSQRTVPPFGLAVSDKPFVIAAGKYAILGPFDQTTFNLKSGADTGKVYVDTNGTGTEVTILPFKD